MELFPSYLQSCPSCVGNLNVKDDDGKDEGDDNDDEEEKNEDGNIIINITI